MSIYIKGIEMPKDNEILCINIKANGDVYYNLDLSVNTIANAIRVPPHGRLIDGDELAAGCDEPHWCRWLSEIEDAPTIIPADKKEHDD